MPSTECFVAVYSHRHGVDFGVYDSYEHACRGTVSFLLDYLDEIDDADPLTGLKRRNELRKLARAGSYAEFINKWNEYHYDEHVEIGKRSMVPENIEVQVDADEDEDLPT